MFDGYENFVLQIDIFVGDKIFEMLPTQEILCCVTCHNATQKRLVEYSHARTGWVVFPSLYSVVPTPKTPPPHPAPLDPPLHLVYY